MDLHYSQTKFQEHLHKCVFYYLMDLHYSQTRSASFCRFAVFYYLMDLHYSQTASQKPAAVDSFTTLWIYTILKLVQALLFCRKVLLPYGFTLFSNSLGRQGRGRPVLLPYGFTLFSNDLQNHLKAGSSFTTLWIYTILKLCQRVYGHRGSFTTLWIYTILKRGCASVGDCGSFTTLWIYTILKPGRSPLLADPPVLLPYGFTLFSNCDPYFDEFRQVLLPYGFTLFSNGSYGNMTVR